MNRRNFIGTLIAALVALLTRRAPKPAKVPGDEPLVFGWAVPADPLGDIRAMKRRMDEGWDSWPLGRSPLGSGDYVRFGEYEDTP